MLIVLARCADVIYWEATGGSAALRARHPLFSAIDTVIAEAGAGPRPKLRAMQLRLQSDGWNCGVWAVVLVEKLIGFVDAGGSGSLDDFVRADTRFVDMSAQVGQKKREADARNKAFIGAQSATAFAQSCATRPGAMDCSLWARACSSESTENGGESDRDSTQDFRVVVCAVPHTRRRSLSLVCCLPSPQWCVPLVQ